MKTIEKYLQARDEVSFKYNKAGAKIWYRAHAIIETGVIDTGKAYAWSCDHDIKINRFQAALILEKYGLTLEQFIDAEKEFYATYYPEETNINEPNPDDYAVNPDALEVAVNAEIQNANTAKINDLKWKIRYTEGSINDLDQNHIAHAPNDQSLKERRAELINELAALKAQLADLLPTEVNTNSEYKYYIQSRRPIAGAVPNGYISATQGDMKVHSLRSDGSISPVPRKVVFGVVVYDHPLSDEQIINYDLHVDPRNPKAEPKTEPTPEVDPIITERQEARNEYYELNHVRNLIEKDVDKIERLRDRCKVGSPKYKAYSRMLADVDPIIRAFGDKFIAAQDRYNQSLTLRTDEERAATQKAIDEHNADLDARGIKYFATVRYYPHGHEGEDMETFHKDCQTLKEATDFVSQEDIDGVYVGGIYDAGWEITDRNGNIVADHNTGIKMTNTTQAGFLKDKIKRDAQPSEEKVFDLLPDFDQLNDVEDEPLDKYAEVNLITKLLDELPKDPNEGNPTLARYITSATATKLGSISWAIRSTDFNRAEKALEIFKSALAAHANEYDFEIELAPKVIGSDDLKPIYYAAGLDGSEEDDDCDEVFDLVPNISELSDIELCDELIDPPSKPYRQKKLRDSINRAIKQCIRNRIGYLKSHNSKMEKYEYELMHLLQGARRELEVA